MCIIWKYDGIFRLSTSGSINNHEEQSADEQDESVAVVDRLVSKLFNLYTYIIFLIVYKIYKILYWMYDHDNYKKMYNN